MTSSGISVYLADAWLNTLSNVPFVVPAVYWQLYTGDPGGAGTSNASATTSRQAGTFAGAANGSFGFTGIPPIWATAAAAETLTNVGAWDSLEGGNFLFPGTLLAARTVAEGDQIALGAFTLSFATLAS